MGEPSVDERDEMLIRHDERIAQLETKNADLAKIVSEQVGYQEGWWQARRESLMEDISANLDARSLKTIRRAVWTSIAAIIAAIVAVVKGQFFP